MKPFPKILFQLGGVIPETCNLLNQRYDLGAENLSDSLCEHVSLNDFQSKFDHYTSEQQSNTLLVSTKCSTDIKKIISEGNKLRSNSISWGLIAQGHLISKAYLKELTSVGIESLFINLDGLIDAHESINKVENSFIDTILIISQTTKEPNINLYVLTNVNSANRSEISDVVNLLDSLHVKHYILNHRLYGNDIDLEKVSNITQLIENTHHQLSISHVFTVASTHSGNTIFPYSFHKGQYKMVQF